MPGRVRRRSPCLSNPLRPRSSHQAAIIRQIFIIGRPEPCLPLLETLIQIFRLHEVKPSNVDDDIRLYLEEKRTAVAKQRSDFDVSNPWPCGEDREVIGNVSSGVRPCPVHQFSTSRAKRTTPAHPHSIGRHCSRRMRGDKSADRPGLGVKEAAIMEKLRRILGAVVQALNPLSRRRIFNINPIIMITLRHPHSVLLVPTEESKEIRILHKSFPDFPQDLNQCPDQKFSYLLSDASWGHLA